MDEINGVIFLRSYYEAIKILKKREQNILYSAIFEYVFEKKVPDLPPNLVPIWTLIRPNLEASARRYTANKRNGTKGGRPSGSAGMKNPTEKPNGNPNAKPNPFIDKDKDTEKEKDTDIYMESPNGEASGLDIYISPAAALSEKERAKLEELCGDKTDLLIESVGAWLAAGNMTKSVYNTCLTFFRNSPKVFTGRPKNGGQTGSSGFKTENEFEFSTDKDGYEVVTVKTYRIYDDGRKELINNVER